MTSSASPVVDIQKASPENSKNAARIGGMDLLNQDYVSLNQTVFERSLLSLVYMNDSNYQISGPREP